MTAGALLRDARTRAGLSQVELALRAGVAQSVISVYESGGRQPSLPTLASLVAATGSAIDVQLAAVQDEIVQTLSESVRARAEEIKDAAAVHGIRVLGVFGSVARGEDGPGSDVDLLVDVPAGVGLFTLGRLEEQLRDLLGANIDLVPEAGLKPRVRAEVSADLVPL
jgi:predicted nucleotidyltransferase